MSSRKGRRIEPAANHLKSDGQLLVAMATSSSMWFDAWWFEANPTGGAKPVSINWFKGFTAAELQDQRCLFLINSARRLVAAMRQSTTLKRHSLRTIFGGRARKILHLVAWMYRNTVWSFADLTPDIADWYKSDLLETGAEGLSEPGDDQDEIEENVADPDTDEITVNVLRGYLNVLVHIFRLSDEFQAFPELRMPEHPFRGQSAQSLAETLAISTDGWIPRVPDEVLNPLMQVVLNWIDVYAADVLLAQDVYLQAMEVPRTFKSSSGRSGALWPRLGLPHRPCVLGKRHDHVETDR